MSQQQPLHRIGSETNGFRFDALLGSGGFATVLRATHLASGEEVAIKVFTHLQEPDDEFSRRFAEEARIVSRLQHPHIVPVYDSWVEDEASFLVMKFVDGFNLIEHIAWHGQLSRAQIAEVARAMGSALHYSHQQGIVHRDVKPENVLIGHDGMVYLADFGVARRADRTSVFTRPGEILGTPGYLAPEQIQSLPITPATDQYALGVLLWELLAGHNPYANLPDGVMLMKTVTEPLPILAEQSLGINDVLQTATAKQPGARYPDVQTFVDDFIAVFTP